jgi:hypothetical protein
MRLADVVHFLPPGELVTLKSVIGSPPLLAGAAHDTVAIVFP